jgi:hypothetical protein
MHTFQLCIDHIREFRAFTKEQVIVALTVNGWVLMCAVERKGSTKAVSALLEVSFSRVNDLPPAVRYVNTSAHVWIFNHNRTGILI